MSEIKTTDLYYAAYLHTLGTLTSIERSGKRCTFVYSVGDEYDPKQLFRAWANSTGLVSAMRYSQALQTLKTQIYSM